MACENINIAGARGIVCGIRRPRCSSCGRARADLECDAPITCKSRPRAPCRGDARVHLEQRRVFYVHLTLGDAIHVAVRPPGDALAVLQVVTLEAWFSKTGATCNRALCRGCAERVGALDLCPAHAREAKTGTAQAFQPERTGR